MYRLLCEDIFPKALGSARVYTHISTFGSITEDWACCTSTNTHVHICCVCTTKIDVHLITYAEFFFVAFPDNCQSIYGLCVGPSPTTFCTHKHPLPLELVVWRLPQMFRKCSPRNWHCYNVQRDCVHSTQELNSDGYTQTLKPNCDKGKSVCVCSSV